MVANIFCPCASKSNGLSVKTRNMPQHTATHYNNTLQHTAIHCNTASALRLATFVGFDACVCASACVRVCMCACVRVCVFACLYIYILVLQCVAVCCSVLQCVAVCCSVLQCVAVCLSLYIYTFEIFLTWGGREQGQLLQR